MPLFNKKSEGGLMNVIRCDEKSYLVWKWCPTNSPVGVTHRENSIRWGSSLRVKDGEVAIFVYRSKNGPMQEFIEGPFDQIIKTSNFPILTKLIGLAYDGKSPFQAEIYFVNLAKVIQVKFGVPFFDVFDPRFLDYGVPTAVRGTVTFKISDYKEFIKLHRLNTFDLNDFQTQIRDVVSNYIKGIVANVPMDNSIPVMQIERKLPEIAEIAESRIISRLKSDFSVSVSGIDISAIEVDKDSEGYRQLKRVTQDITTATTQARANVNIQDLHDMQRINAENKQATLRIQREEAQYAQHLQTQSGNIATHQLNQQAGVGIAGAEALGKMGGNGAFNIEGGGMNPVAIMSGMALGGVLGQNMAGMMNGMMNGMNQPVSGITPPPIRTSVYHVAVNGQAMGPYDVSILTQMAINRQFAENSLVWKPGMSEWVEAKDVEELKPAFSSNIPPIPTSPPVR